MPSAYPLTHELKIALYVDDLESLKDGYVTFDDGAFTFGLHDLVQPAYRRLAIKIGRAQGYTRDAPLWLILSMSDPRGSASSATSLDQLRHPIAIAPFERVIIHDGRAAIDIGPWLR